MCNHAQFTKPLCVFHRIIVKTRWVNTCIPVRTLNTCELWLLVFVNLYVTNLQTLSGLTSLNLTKALWGRYCNYPLCQLRKQELRRSLRTWPHLKHLVRDGALDYTVRTFSFPLFCLSSSASTDGPVSKAQGHDMTPVSFFFSKVSSFFFLYSFACEENPQATFPLF